jgi:hypothetical protein
MLRRGILAALLVAGLGVVRVSGHHSFAVFFEDKTIVKVTGAVTAFRFTNPHGTIEFTATGKDGRPEAWRAETNAPTLLRRRGWTKDSLKIGETITVEGWPARDGSKYMRMRTVTRADGTVLSTPVTNQAVEK